ncbi:hypothetical protein H310_04578 [Aphanomyces invadans]|uniref:Uncharacterized protein n=1 Tax=Aphanomyces invadans TaxID=157072 RepID=A0A024UDA3_9STRA|nr:hypothetical protein H310_04578 [Aphanomyces invadans]ETW04249.1 hypothetical protein H310_04578 [Aphanomyces invadans]|eukprot:XP_008867205.1 hypothetical protein H310_04578 [Aphanomyces invadans]
MGDKEKRQVIKLHKQFLEEIDACNVLERQGLQGFSSLVNIAQRLPLVMSEKESKYGVLDGMNSIRVFLKKRHFESLEKTSTYIAQVIQGFFDRVENMQRAMSTCADVLDRMPIQDQHVFVVELMEWMENVLAMYEREYPFDELLLVSYISAPNVVVSLVPSLPVVQQGEKRSWVSASNTGIYPTSKQGTRSGCHRVFTGVSRQNTCPWWSKHLRRQYQPSKGDRREWSVRTMAKIDELSAATR